MSDKIKQIITDPDKLSDWSSEIDVRKEGKLLQEIVLALKHTMKELNLECLSAPEIGYNKRVMCIRFGKTDYRTFVNPMIENNYNIQFARETCSSIPDKTFIIPRFGGIKAFFTTPLGKVESCKLDGKAAFVFQHCVDHLNGLLVSDIGLEIDEMFDNATDEERSEVLRMYAESLDLKQKQLEDEIKEDPELKKIVDATNFLISVNKGETILETGKKDE